MKAGWLRGKHGGKNYFSAKPDDPKTWFGDHYNMTTRRRIFEAYHKTAGYFVYFFAAGAVASGLMQYPMPGMATFVVAMVIIAFLVSIVLEYNGISATRRLSRRALRLHDGRALSIKNASFYASSQDLPKPDYAKNMKLIGYSDQGGRPDGVQVMVNKGHAYVGHMFSKGFSVIDVRDPRNPKPVNYIPALHNTWTIHLQTYGDLLLVINAMDMFAAEEFQDERAYYTGSHAEKAEHTYAEPKKRDWTAGLAVYDISKPAEPRKIGFMPVEGGGIHRIWYTGGRWAYVSAMLDGFTDYIFMTIDMADPTKPKEAGRYWLPGMNTAAGDETGVEAPDRRFRSASCDHPWRYRLWRLARRRSRDDRRVGPHEAEADQASQLVAALWRRNA